MKEMTVLATVENIRAVTEFVDGELMAAGCSPKVRTQIDIAVDELFGNIARYAYAPKRGFATVRVEVANDPPEAKISFIDHGMPYNPLLEADPDITLSARERPIGGLGIYMVKKSMDGISYEYKDGQNILRVTKNILAPKGGKSL